MARILSVTNFVRKPGTAFLHTTGIKISNGLIRNGHFVANFSDRDMARIHSLFGHRKFGVGAANRELRSLCRDMAPDLLLLGHADVIWPETIAQIRAELPALRVLQWNVDAMFTPDNVARLSANLDVVDATLVTTAGEDLKPLVRPGKFLGFLPNPVDPSVETGCNYRQDKLPYDLFFPCGNDKIPRYVCGQDWRMTELVREIERGAPGLRMLTPGVAGQPKLAGAAYQRALESAAIGLNISRRNDHFLYSSDRLAHMIGNGMAVLIDRATGYDRLFDDDELAFFSTVDELVEKIRWLIADPSARRRLAESGRRRYHALFNERAVARYMVDAAFGTFRAEDYPWPALSSSEAPRMFETIGE